MNLQRTYDALSTEAFGFMRPWEIARLTDETIERLFAAQRRYAKAAKAAMEGRPTLEEIESMETVQPAPMRDFAAKIDRGETPTFEEAWEGLYRFSPNLTPETARPLYDAQLAAWLASK